MGHARGARGAPLSLAGADNMAKRACDGGMVTAPSGDDTDARMGGELVVFSGADCSFKLIIFGK